jgi:hypothetical protein
MGGKERCESGRIGLTANELTGLNPSEGSNPSLSASVMSRDIPDSCRETSWTLFRWLLWRKPEGFG